MKCSWLSCVVRWVEDFSGKKRCSAPRVSLRVESNMVSLPVMNLLSKSEYVTANADQQASGHSGERQMKCRQAA